MDFGLFFLMQRDEAWTGYHHVLLLMALPGLGTAEALRSMRLFAEEVRPAMKPLAQRV